MKLFLVILSIFITTSNAFAHDSVEHHMNNKVLKVYTELDLVPFNFYNKKNQLVGIGVDLVNEMLKDAKFEHTRIRVLPWARSYHLTQTVPNTMLFSMYRTPQREKLFDWIGPIAESNILIVTKKDAQFDPDNYKVAALRNSAFMQYALKSGIHEQNIMKTNESRLGLKLLNLGRIDAWVVDYHTAVEQIRKHNLKTQDYVIYKTLAKQDLYIALNKDTNPDIKNYFAEKMQLLTKNGFLEKTLEKYNHGPSHEHVLKYYEKKSSN